LKADAYFNQTRRGCVKLEAWSRGAKISGRLSGAILGGETRAEGPAGKTSPREADADRPFD